MDSRLTRRIAQYVGIGAAVIVPALVVAQQATNPPTTNFAAGELLRASDIDQLRDALVEAIGRINALEAGQTGPLRKSNVYLAPEAIVPNAINDIVSATSSCTNGADLLVDCSCYGRSTAGTDATNSTSMDLRQVRSRNNASAGVNSACSCTGRNSGSNPDAVLIAQATCLRIQ